MEIKLRFFVIPNSSAFLFSLCSACDAAGWMAGMLSCSGSLFGTTGEEERSVMAKYEIERLSLAYPCVSSLRKGFFRLR